MTENELSYKIIGAALEVHKTLGVGLLESAYEVLTYLKLTNIKLGLLINFNTPLIKDGIHRIVNKL
jgi:hypothetical protein